MNRAANFIKTAGIYMLGTVFSKLVSLFLLPLYTNYLEPSLMGEYDYANTIVSFLAPICFFQIWDAMFRFSFEKDDDKYKTRVINNAFYVELCGIAVYAVVFLIVNSFTHFQCAPLAMIFGFCIAINYLYAYVARAYLDNVLFVVSGFANSLITILLNIVLIVGMGVGLESLFISASVGLIVQCLIIEVKIKPLSKLDIADLDKPLIREMIKFSVPLCVSTISFWLFSGLTKVIIVNKLGTYENGLYSVTNRIAMILNLVVSIFQYAWNETAYMSNADENRFDMFTVAARYIVQYVMVFAVILMLVAKLFFPVFIGDMYQEAAAYLPVSIAAVAFNSVAGFYGTIISTEKKTNYIFVSTLIAAAANCVLVPVMANIWGLYGALTALTISFAILMVIRSIMISRKMNVKIRVLDFWPVLLLAVGYLLCEYAGIVVQIIAIILIIVFEIIINKNNLSVLANSMREKINCDKN